MADKPTVIGSGTLVRGRVSGSGDLEISGRVEGDVACSGDVTVERDGMVGASITAHRIIIRGAVKGDLTAEDALLLEAGARVVGDLRAPRIAIAPGGLVRGHVQTGGAGAAKPRAAQASARVSAPAAKSSAKAAPPPPPPAKKAAPPLRGAGSGLPEKSATKHRGSVLAGSRVGPPAPVVPALKKGTKAVKKSSR